jgi:hypothetical protein
MIDPPPLMAGIDQSHSNMWRKMLANALHKHLPAACAT